MSFRRRVLRQGGDAPRARARTEIHRLFRRLEAVGGRAKVIEIAAHMDAHVPRADWRRFLNRAIQEAAT